MNDKEIALELTKFALNQKIIKTYNDASLGETMDKTPLDFAKEIASLYNTIYKELTNSKNGDDN